MLALTSHWLLKSALIGLVFAGFSLATPNCLARPNGRTTDSWDNLRRVTHRKTYAVRDRQGRCTYGWISTVAAGYVTFTTPKGARVRVERQDVLSLTTYPTYPLCIVYSGRSSWADVLKYSPSAKAMIITTKDRSIGYAAEAFLASDTSVTLDQGGRTIKLAKTQISTLDIISSTPWSDGITHWVEACDGNPMCGALDPAVWPRLFGFRAKMQVRLFNASLPEEDGAIDCEFGCT